MTTTTTVHRPLGSGLGPRTTATEALAGIDLTGTVALVTGGASGLGLEATRALAAAGATVVVAVRRPETALSVLADVPRVEVEQLDLADLDGVRAFAERFLATGRPLDILLANAGIMACPRTEVGPGWEAQLAVNHLGHYALVNHLRPALERRGARVVSLSSGAHGITPMRWSDLHLREDYDKWVAYGQSKTANVLFSVHLDALGRDRGIRGFSLNPGAILTPLQRHLSREEMVAAGWIHEDGSLADPSFKTPQQGAATAVWAATSPLLDGLGGAYCEDCDVAPVRADGPGVRPYAVDPAEAARLWAVSAELTGVDTFTTA